MTAITEGQRKWRLGAALEIATSCVVALAYFATCYLIKISATERMGQVSILAALAYHFLWFAIPLVVSLIVVARYRPAQWGLAVRLVCAADHEEWITVMFPGIRAVSRVVLVPAAEGFPVDFTIDVWDGKEWATRIARAGYQVTPGPQTFSWGPRLRTSKVRLHVTKLGPAGGQFGLYLGELGAYR